MLARVPCGRAPARHVPAALAPALSRDPLQHGEAAVEIGEGGRIVLRESSLDGEAREVYMGSAAGGRAGDPRGAQGVVGLAGSRGADDPARDRLPAGPG